MGVADAGHHCGSESKFAMRGISKARCFCSPFKQKNSGGKHKQF